jgi:hypothetical protein
LQGTRGRHDFILQVKRTRAPEALPLGIKKLTDGAAMSPVIILLGLVIPIGILTWADWRLRRELPGGNGEK